jgi:Uncharacterized protein conserved in archaea
MVPRKERFFMKLNARELEVLKILHESDRALTSTEIVNSGTELTQSTVQAVLRKLLTNELIEVQGITYSGNVLSRTFCPTAKSRDMLTDKFLQDFKCFRTIISVPAALAGMFSMSETEDERNQDIQNLEKLLSDLKKQKK